MRDCSQQFRSDHVFSLAASVDNSVQLFTPTWNMAWSDSDSNVAQLGSVRHSYFLLGSLLINLKLNSSSR